MTLGRISLTSLIVASRSVMSSRVALESDVPREFVVLYASKPCFADRAGSFDPTSPLDPIMSSFSKRELILLGVVFSSLSYNPKLVGG